MCMNKLNTIGQTKRNYAATHKNINFMETKMDFCVLENTIVRLRKKE